MKSGVEGYPDILPPPSFPLIIGLRASVCVSPRQEKQLNWQTARGRKKRMEEKRKKEGGETKWGGRDKEEEMVLRSENIWERDNCNRKEKESNK